MDKNGCLPRRDLRIIRALLLRLWLFQCLEGRGSHLKVHKVLRSYSCRIVRVWLPYMIGPISALYNASFVQRSEVLREILLIVLTTH